MHGLHLTRTSENVAEIDALAERHGGRVGLAGITGALERRLRRTVAPCLSRHRAWTWDRTDRRDPAWWPQGVSTSDLADVGIEEQDLLAVSWYAKHGGARVSILDLDAGRYQHATLVVPTGDGHQPLRVHAGGLAWHGRYLHVAATSEGFWTCSTNDLVRGPDGFLLPVRFGYRAAAPQGTEPLRYSFLSVDADSSPPRLLVGEYGSRRQTRRLAQFPLDPESLLLATDEEERSQPAVIDDGVVRAQGAVAVRGHYHLTASHGPWVPGSLWSGAPGALQERRFAVPMGPEDLAHSPATDRLWTVTEHPRRRWVVTLPTPSLG